MEIPPPDPKKLLVSWMEWERGDATPGRVMANLKTGGMRELLESLAAEAPQAADEASSPQEAAGEVGPEVVANWAPIV